MKPTHPAAEQAANVQEIDGERADGDAPSTATRDSGGIRPHLSSSPPSLDAALPRMRPLAPQRRSPSSMDLRVRLEELLRRSSMQWGRDGDGHIAAGSESRILPDDQCDLFGRDLSSGGLFHRHTTGSLVW